MISCLENKIKVKSKNKKIKNDKITTMRNWRLITCLWQSKNQLLNAEAVSAHMFSFEGQ